MIKKQQHIYLKSYKNGFIVFWILHKIIMYSKKVKLVAG